MQTAIPSPKAALPLIQRSTLNRALYLAVTLIVLTLTGIFDAFANRDVIEDQITLSSVFLLGALLASGYLTAIQAAERALPVRVVNGLLGSLAVGAAIAATTLLTSSIDVTFVFANLKPLFPSAVTFEQDTMEAGLVVLMGVSAVMGLLAALSFSLGKRLRETLYLTLGLTVITGILQAQIDSIITQPDALLIALTLGASYLMTRQSDQGQPRPLLMRLLTGAALGLAIGAGLAIIAPVLGLERDTLLRGSGSMPTLLWFAAQGEVGYSLFFVLITTGIGALGALLRPSPQSVHNGAWYFVVMLLVLGVLNWQRGMTLLGAGLVFALIFAVLWVLPPVGAHISQHFEALRRGDQAATRRLSFVFLFAVLIVVPGFAGQSISNTLNLVMLYVIMGIGLNVMIGMAGLLDLGYVASFAIGAYTAGIVTTPNLLTCGWQDPQAILDSGQTLNEVCTGVMTYWQGWPVAIVVAAFTGMALGVPVLRLRGDYLAIVTLGFGEISNRILKSDTFKAVFGGPQGISPIPVPVINLSGIMPPVPLPSAQLDIVPISDFMRGITTYDHRWVISLSKATEIYYLYLFAVIAAALVVGSLINTRLGRAWRALREDEDVAEAMGIHLVWTKLLAFGVSSSFAGLGGAIFGASLQGIFPNSFTILISVNVLSLVIIGGMGSIPGVFLGAVMLVGLPEILRELQDYRLLVFGALLVIAMITRPEGLLPPQPPRLSERVRDPNAQPDPTPASAAAPAAGD